MSVITKPTPRQEQTGARPSDDVLLEIEDLQIHFETTRGIARVVDGANLTLNRNEIFGIAGESGSGKTTLVEAILQIIRFPNRIARGSVRFYPSEGDPVDLMRLSKQAMRRFRWEQISYIPQGSMNSLNPVMRIGEQIADEPTTALDVNVQRVILETLANLRQEFGIAILIVSHDLPVHAQLVDRIGVMYAGQIVEVGPIRPTVKTPLHPYTQGLMASIPAIGGERHRLDGIAGTTPSPLNWPEGCRFHTRCPYVMDDCRRVDPIRAPIRTGPRKVGKIEVNVTEGRSAACHLHPESTPGDQS